VKSRSAAGEFRQLANLIVRTNCLNGSQHQHDAPASDFRCTTRWHVVRFLPITATRAADKTHIRSSFNASAGDKT